jgi:dihydroorotase
MSHAVADCFSIESRGYIREGYFADLAIVDLNKNYTVQKENILYKCGWSPLEEYQLPSSVLYTFVNGHLVYENGKLNLSQNGKRLTFNRS